MKRTLFLVFISAAAPCSAEMTGKALYGLCGQAPNTATDGFCTGYIQGVVEGAMDSWARGAWRRSGGTKPSTKDAPFCTEESFTVGDAMNIVNGYLASNKDQHDASASALILNALEIARPCR